MRRAQKWMMVSCLAAVAFWQPALTAQEPKPADVPPAEKPAAETPSQPQPAEQPSPPAKPAGQTPPPAKPAEEKPAPMPPPPEWRRPDQKPGEEKKPKTPDPFIVPEGTPQELLDYIQTVRKTKVTNIQMAIRARMALMRAAEQIIAAQPPEKEMTTAVQLKMQLLGGREQIAEFAVELKEDGHDKCARLVRNVTLRIDLAQAERQQPHNRKKAIEEALKFLEEAPPETADAALAAMAGKTAELTGDDRYAAEVYMAVSKPFTASKDEKLAEIGRTLAGTSRRLSLPGNEIRITGFLPNGEPFDWSKYQGKVVLIDFWSTWSGTSVNELSKIKKYYDQYHGRGFEIVGVSCDQRPADLKKFLLEREIPWAIVYGKDKPSPSVEYYGITEIPTKILVGKDGLVISLNARGLKLKEELLKIFGPTEEKKRVPLE